MCSDVTHFLVAGWQSLWAREDSADVQSCVTSQVTWTWTAPGRETTLSLLSASTWSDHHHSTSNTITSITSITSNTSTIITSTTIV